MQHDRSGFLVALAAYLIWGFLTVYWKLLHDFNAFELIGHRIVWSSLLLAVVLGFTRRARTVVRALRDRRTAARLALASLVLAANWISYVTAVVQDHVVETALGYFIAPIATMLVGVLVLHETLRPRQRAALVLSSAAVLVLTVAYGRVPWLALGMAATWATYGYLKKQVPLGPMESLAGETFVLFLPALVLVTARQAQGEGVLVRGTTTQVVLVLLAGVATAVPLVMFAYAAKRLPFTVLGPLNYLVPTINFLLGVFAYHEPVDGARLAGFAMVWVALAIMAVDSFGGSPVRQRNLART